MKIWNEIWDYVKMIIIVVVVVLFVNNFILINAKIPSESMENTIMTGDRVFGFRLAYGLNVDLFGNHISKKVKDPERFDIIIFKYPDDERDVYKRQAESFSVQYRNTDPFTAKPLIEDYGTRGYVCLLYTSCTPVMPDKGRQDRKQENITTQPGDCFKTIHNGAIRARCYRNSAGCLHYEWF